MLQFYVEEFDEKKYGIDLLHDVIYYRKEEYPIDSTKMMKA